MSYEIPGRCVTLEASADLSAEQFKLVVVDANGRAAVAGAGAHCAGVLQNDPDALGRAGTVMIDGLSRVIAGAAVAPGANVAADASGRAVTAATGQFVVGIAFTGCANANEWITVELKPAGPLP